MGHKNEELGSGKPQKHYLCLLLLLIVVNINSEYYFPDMLTPRRGYLSVLGAIHFKADYDTRTREQLFRWELGP